MYLFKIGTYSIVYLTPKGLVLILVGAVSVVWCVNPTAAADCGPEQKEQCSPAPCRISNTGQCSDHGGICHHQNADHHSSNFGYEGLAYTEQREHKGGTLAFHHTIWE